MLRSKSRAWAEVSLDHIASNYRAMAEFLHPGCQIIAVLKADGYGHGAVPVGRLLESLGCQLFAVACLEEGLELRVQGISRPILLLSPVFPGQAALAAEENMVLPLVDPAQARELSAWAVRNHRQLNAFIMADCGLSRFGVVVPGREEQAAEAVCEMARLPNLIIHSLMTHLTAGGVPEQDSLNVEQLSRFQRFSQLLERRGLFLPKHCCASRFAVRYPDFQFDFARIGSDLYGVHPYYGTGPRFLPGMELKARLLQVKEVAAGSFIGYGPAFTAQQDTKVAVLPLGYVDGLSCRLGSRMEVLIHGRRAPQIGRLCMDSCMIDVTHIPNVQAGDVATIFGQDAEGFLSVQEHAKLYPGTASELICLLGKRIPRFYYQNGKEMSGC